jgi:hypothetical protein
MREDVIPLEAYAEVPVTDLKHVIRVVQRHREFVKELKRQRRVLCFKQIKYRQIASKRRNETTNRETDSD